jgi:LysM repeat protein
MGTTCVVVLVRENELNYAHVGDSRLYLLSNNRLMRLTKDHSVVQEMVSQGMIKEEEAENHPRKNELTRALGTQYNVQVEVCERPLYPSNNDIFLLCTDGLNGMINDAVIKQVLTENVTLQHKAIKLVQLANDAGGFDNITVQLIQFNTNSSNVIAEDMAATKANAKTKTKKKVTTTQVINQRVDPALIVLCILVGVVIILFFVGYDQLSDGTISTSELTQEQLNASQADEDISESGTTQLTTASQSAEESQKEKKGASNSVQPVAKKVNKETKQPAATPDKAVSGKEAFISHTVRAGETFSAVARRYNVTNKTLKSWNPEIRDEGKDLKSDVTILRVKVRAVHKVEAGDVMAVVGKKYGVSKELIMAANGKTADRTSRGETLVIPFAEKK